jgi:beta-1,4-mannosyl-glycoprotein beta-1,4-N-acetylglucosaminyltransferase
MPQSEMSRPKIFDCFTFFNELDLLEIRLAELYPLVDRFVLVEAARTFQGDPKPLCFQENRERFKPWLDKIDHIVIDVPDRIRIRPDQTAAWNREYYQRNQIARGLTGAAPHDLVMVSDVDEIVARDKLQGVLESGAYRGWGVCFYMPIYQFYMRCKAPWSRWPGPRMVEFKTFTTAQKLRSLRFEHKTIWSKVGLGNARLRLRNWERCGISVPVRMVEDSGWHFTSTGGYGAWKKKVDSFSHEEHKGLYAGEQDILDIVRNHDVVSLDKMPILVRENPTRFEELLAPPERAA